MRKIYYVSESIRFTMGFGFLSTLMAIGLVLLTILTFLQEHNGMGVAEYIQKNLVLLVLSGIVIGFFLFCAISNFLAGAGKYRIDSEGLQYKNGSTHRVIRWQEIQRIETDGFGTLMIHAPDKRFMFSLLAVQQYHGFDESFQLNYQSILESFAEVLRFSGMLKKKEISPYAEEVTDFILEKLEQLRIELEYNTTCGFKWNKNVKATYEKFE